MPGEYLIFILKRKIILFSKYILNLVFHVFNESLVIDPNFFRDKKIIVIGPAKTVTEEIKNIQISDYDIVVRMNRAIDFPIALNGDLLWRIDILFHNLKESGDRGAGLITQEKCIRSGLKLIIFPAGGKDKLKNLLIAKLKMLLRSVKAQVRMIPEDAYLRARNSINGYSPTTGFMVLFFLMRCDIKKLHVIGFTFFQTKYIEGYNDNLKNDENAILWATNKNIHNPTLEKVSIKKLLYNGRVLDPRIILGKYVLKSLK